VLLLKYKNTPISKKEKKKVNTQLFLPHVFKLILI